MAESVPLEDPETGKTSNQCCYFKMKVLNGHDSNEIINVAEDNFDERLFVFNDKSKSYVDLYKYVDIHIAENSTKETASKSLPWVHFAISNAKRNIHGAYHKIKGKYLQLYLDEFCYKLNSRYFGDRLFDMLTIVMAYNYWYNKD